MATSSSAQAERKAPQPQALTKHFDVALGALRSQPDLGLRGSDSDSALLRPQAIFQCFVTTPPNLAHLLDSDVTGKAARQMIQAMIARERDSCRLATMHLDRFDELGATIGRLGAEVYRVAVKRSRSPEAGGILYRLPGGHGFRSDEHQLDHLLALRGRSAGRSIAGRSR
jgi:hypothetical protein